MELLKPILIYYKKTGFTLAIDLTFLITNIAKKNAIGVSVSSAKTEIVNNKLSTAVIFIDPAQVLLPIANFTNSIDNLSKIRNYVNTSGNGITHGNLVMVHPLSQLFLPAVSTRDPVLTAFY